MKAVIIIICFVIALIIANFIRNKRNPSLLIEAHYFVSFDNDTISVIDPDGNESFVPIKKLTKIDILTTEDGPWAPDVFWRFYTDDNNIAIIFPGGATGENKLLTFMQDNFKNFDSDAVIRAMGSTSLATFKVWTHA